MKKRPFLKKIIRTLGYAKPHWKLFLFVFILAVISSLVALINPYLQKYLFDDVLLGKEYNLLFILGGVFLSVYVFTKVFSIIQMYFNSKLTQSIIFSVKKQLFDHLERLHLDFYQKKKVGDMMTRFDNDVIGIQEVINTLLNSALLNILTGFSILVVSFNLSWKATAFALLFFPAYLFTQRMLVQKTIKQYKSIKIKSADMFSFLQERLSAMKAIKEFGREKLESKIFKKKGEKLISLNLKAQMFGTKSRLLTGLIVYIPSFVILFYGGYQVMTGVITIGILLVLRTYIQQLFMPITSLGSLHKTLKTNMVSVDRVYDILDVKPKIKEKPDAKLLRRVKGNIIFKNVSFSYGSKKILDNVNLDIKPGEKIGLVGPSGGGKSTIANLLMRFYDANKGFIKIDGMKLCDIKLESLRKHVGIVSQETILFNMSIKDNIRFGKPNASKKQVIQAAKLANIHDFIRKLPKGYDTIVGEKGAGLSGGQKQRISIARLILKNPKIVILDEATSALDSESEKIVQHALDNVLKEKTALIIAHRLSTLENVDKIMVLDNEQIVEQGSFSELMEKKEIFYRLYNLQFKGYHQFEQRLDQEIERAKISKKPLTMVVFDFKDFENILNKHGKKRAIEFIEKVNSLIEKNLRKIDFYTPVPRGENISLIVMPEINESNTQKIVDKIINDIKKNVLQELKVRHIIKTGNKNFAGIRKVITELV
jgi:ABC-type multidrug transport system fused ATPase/permease subunit